MDRTSLAQGPALVAYGPLSAGQWKLETVHARALRDDEVLVRVVATGICLADVHFGDASEHDQGESTAIYYPRVLGHEGSGYVEELGESISHLAIGDPVLLSFNSCGTCYACHDGHPAYCANMFDLNFVAEREVYQADGSRSCSIGGCFFGQSSFASRAVVSARCVVNLRGVVDSVEELQSVAPLGCGIQTGSAAMLNVSDVQAGQDVAIIGVGGVGMSAVMASHMVGCRRIIAIDRNACRLETAKTLGATHTINTADGSVDLIAEVLKLSSGNGVHVSLDTSGNRDLARASYHFVRNGGKIVPVGLAKPHDTWDIPMVDFMNSGKQIRGCVQGDVVPQTYVLDMIKWQREGRFPFEKITTFYDVRRFEEALEGMRSGGVVKPILIWPHTDKPRSSLASL